MPSRKIAVSVLFLLGLAASYAVIQEMREDQTMTQANAQDIQKILSEALDQVYQYVPRENTELSLPLDGKGARLLVRVEEGASASIPETIVIDLDGKLHEVPVEVSETYEAYSASTD